MSRAFVKETDGDDADNDLPERPLSLHPNYVTPGGLRKLHAQLQRLREQRETLIGHDDDMNLKTQLKQAERDLRYLDHCVQSAIVVDSGRQPHDEVRFGAAVEVIDEGNATHTFTIVGEHETCAPTGFISWVSPLATSLLGRRVGDTVLWERPAGNMELEITAIRYPDLS